MILELSPMLVDIVRSMLPTFSDPNLALLFTTKVRWALVNSESSGVAWSNVTFLFTRPNGYTRVYWRKDYAHDTAFRVNKAIKNPEPVEFEFIVAHDSEWRCFTNNLFDVWISLRANLMKAHGLNDIEKVRCNVSFAQRPMYAIINVAEDEDYDNKTRSIVFERDVPVKDISHFTKEASWNQR